MKNLLRLLCIISVTTANAATIKCFSSGKEIYRGHPAVILSDGSSFLASYAHYDDVIFTKQCIITEERKNALTKRKIKKNRK